MSFTRSSGKDSSTDCCKEFESEMRHFKVALVQMNAGREIGPNIDAASRLIREARGAGAELILTPENTSLIEQKRSLVLEKARTEAEHPAIPAFKLLAAETGARTAGDAVRLTDAGALDLEATEDGSEITVWEMWSELAFR